MKAGTKHTKGDWKAGDAHDFGASIGGVYVIIDDNRICIAEVDFSRYRKAFAATGEDFPKYISREAEEANAKLIAAAPDLLEALKKALGAMKEAQAKLPAYKSYDRLAQKLANARGKGHEAIKKATGQ